MRATLTWTFSMQAAIGLAQSWCAPGALWYHEYPYTASGDHGYVETRYTGNVLFADSVCEAFSIVEHGWSDQTSTPWQGGPFTMHTRTSADGSVHLWDGTAFDTLFHFSAVPGDHWRFPSTWWDEGTRITVTDTGHATLDGLSLRYLTIEATLADIVFVADTIFERIGPLQMFLDVQLSHQFLIDGGYGALRCYSDDEIEVIRVEGPCAIALGTEEAQAVGLPVLFPNPGTDRLTITTHQALAPNSTVQLVDAQGRVIAATNWGTAQSGWYVG
ncbi:MAG: hypothetical protein JNM62_08995, partial [Flavobacteriales bacterium]|nr:hypothetical protein [Flavobacteriales bacterium]